MPRVYSKAVKPSQNKKKAAPKDTKGNASGEAEKDKKEKGEGE